MEVQCEYVKFRGEIQIIQFDIDLFEKLSQIFNLLSCQPTLAEWNIDRRNWTNNKLQIIC